MVSVMDSAGPGCDEQPVLPAWHRHQCGDTLQRIAVPLPGKTLHGTVNVVPYTGCFFHRPFLTLLLVSLLLPSSLLSSHTLIKGVIIFLSPTQSTKAREVQRSHSGFLNTWVRAETAQLWGAFPARGNQSRSDLVLTVGDGNSCLPLARSILCHCSIS